MALFERPMALQKLVSCDLQQPLILKASSTGMIPEIDPPPVTTSYYDLPIHSEAPEYERKICHYLASHDVKMSHPSMKQFFTPGNVKTAKTLKIESCSLMKRRTRVGSVSYKQFSAENESVVARSKISK